MSANPFLNNPFFPTDPFLNDPFDSLLNRMCSIWEKQPTGGTDGYGHALSQFVLLKDDVPCWHTPVKGEELNVPPAPVSQTSALISQHLILMRPVKVGDPEIALNPRHFLQIKAVGELNKDPNDSASGAQMYDITFVDNVENLDHHIEINATLVQA